MGIDDIAVRLENRIPVVDIFVELKNSSLFKNKMLWQF